MCKFNCLDDIPTAEQFRHVLNRMRYRRLFAATLRSTAAAVAVAAAAAVLLSWLLLPVIRVTGTSMEPLVSNGQIVLCNKLCNVERGDVVAMYYNKKILLKRVIAVAGDVVDMDETGHVILNGEKLSEPYVSEFALGECDIEFPYTVKENRWFVMGDNRSVSIDSRASVFGCVSDENILGVVWLRIYPFDQPHRLGEKQ
jgi:signal peptidase I